MMPRGIGRPRINTTQLKTFAIPLCSRAEQNEIISQLSEKLSLTDNIDASNECEIEKCEVLRQSILKRAFSGKLVAQDTNDEPAAVLLERIKAETENGEKKIRGQLPHEYCIDSFKGLEFLHDAPR
jgi:type I restriction enzyme S subunit